MTKTKTVSNLKRDFGNMARNEMKNQKEIEDLQNRLRDFIEHNYGICGSCYDLLDNEDKQCEINKIAARAEKAERELAELREQTRWIPVSNIPYMRPGELSEPFYVQVEEFGNLPGFAVARCWKSSQPESGLKWYLDEAFYNLQNPYEIGEITYYMPLPKPAPLTEAEGKMCY